MNGAPGNGRNGSRANVAFLERLMRYLLCLEDPGFRPSASAVSSGSMAEHLRLDATQVRKDLAAVGVRGTPRVGYGRQAVTAAIRDYLGFDRVRRAVIVGMGRLGGAIAAYGGFREFGVEIVGCFDTDPGKIGRRIAGHRLRSLNTLPKFAAEHRAELGILTCPARAAQEVADILVAAGVRALWNFAPVSLSVPAGVSVRNEQLSLGLAELQFALLHG
jgi:redox-sensing transcriptional repressor